jgi:aryl-alcohol dehydrogenase-like predicted oxidoreductase
MELRAFGATGLRVSALGFGAGELGAAELSDAEVSRLLGEVLDCGVNLIDTAPSYGASEERLGQHLASWRESLVLSTKCGYGVPGMPDWTGETVTRGLEQALRRLRTDRLDILHLHSCPLEVLRRDDILDAMREAVRSGKLRVAAYSGEEPALAFAIQSGVFQSVQTSVSVCDQRGIEGGVAQARARGLGVIAKRPLANAVWRFDQRPPDACRGVYWDRFQKLQVDACGLSFEALFLRFAAFQPGVSSAIVGTRQATHLRSAVAAISRGPLPSALDAALKARFRECDDGWMGQI